MKQGVVLSIKIIKRIVMSFGVVIVNALSKWTNEHLDAIQGICLVSLIFVTAIQLNKHTTQPKLIRFVCLLFCNQQVRRLFVTGDNSATDLFPNILLATALAVVLTLIADRKDPKSMDDLRTMLEGLMYMYGDILDFLFAYSILPTTAAAFGVSVFIQSIKGPQNPMTSFFNRLTGIISTNLLYQGVSSLINSTTHLKLIESIATTAILRLILPSMESYLTFLTAIQITSIVPNISPIMLCIIALIDIIPAQSRGWISELCTTYIILAIIKYLSTIPTWGAAVILIMAHYIDYIIVHLQ